MKKLKFNKLLFCVCISLICMCIIFALNNGDNEKTIRVYADGVLYTDADYTDNDKLLTNTGNQSDKTVQQFSTEVKNAKGGTCFDELEEVIPKQYLYSTEYEAVYQYNGKEYGYYVAKEGDNFDVLLIDFIYDFTDREHFDNEYTMRIK